MINGIFSFLKLWELAVSIMRGLKLLRIANILGIMGLGYSQYWASDSHKRLEVNNYTEIGYAKLFAILH